MEQRVQMEQQNVMRQQVAQHLLDNTTMELPERVTAQQAARTLERRRMDLLSRGVDPIRIEENLAELRAGSAETAVRELKLFFILDRAAEKFDVKVTDAEMNGRIAQMAMASGQRPEKLRQDIIQRNQVPMVYTQIREHKTMDAILSASKITEMSVDDYNAHVAAKEKSGGTAPAAAAEKGNAGEDAKESKPKKSSKKKSE
jgi:trigger factor